MSAIPDEARAVLESDALAHLVTINPDGTPQVSCVWVGLEDDEVAFGSLGPRRKLDNIRRDPRVTLSLEGSTVSALGLKEYLVVYGRGDPSCWRASFCRSQLRCLRSSLRCSP